MDKINFVNLPSTTTPVNASNLNLLQTNVETAIGEVVQRTSNENGTAIKFADGTMICTKTVEETNLSFNTAEGSLYVTEDKTIDLGNYPESFISTPVVSTQLYHYGSQYNLMVGRLNYADKSSIGKLNVMSPIARTVSVQIMIIAIGRWK